MDKDSDKPQRGGGRTQGIDSDGQRASKNASARTVPPKNGAEAVARSKERLAALLEQLRRTKPERTMKLIDGIPPAYRGRAIRVLAGKLGNKARIRANCEQCVGWEDVSRAVGQCKVHACMFWDVRPYQKKAGEDGGQ